MVTLTCFTVSHACLMWMMRLRMNHLGTLQTEFKSYFPELSPDAFTLMRNPFRFAIEQVDDESQDELIDFRNDSGGRDLFEDVSVT